MEMSHFLSLALTEILHLKKHLVTFFFYILEIKQCVIWTIAPSLAINVTLFVFN